MEAAPTIACKEFLKGIDAWSMKRVDANRNFYKEAPWNKVSLKFHQLWHKHVNRSET